MTTPLPGVAGLYQAFDAEFPPSEIPAGCAAVLGYTSGQRAANIWAPRQWLPFAGIRQFPCHVPDFGAEDPVSSARTAVQAALNLGWAAGMPERRVIVCDAETLTDPEWYAEFANEVDMEEFTSVLYGSIGNALLNAASDLWVADWGVPTMPDGQTIHAAQIIAGVPFGGTLVDYSVIDHWMLARGGVGPRHV